MLKLVTVSLCLAVAWAAAPSARIIGGVGANAAQFPFAAAIYISTSSGTFFCGGALVDNQHVLTSAQCLEGGVLFTIRLGSTSLNDNDANAVRLATDSYFIHPDFNQQTLENDIGLIRFRAPITFSDYVKAIDILPSTTLPDYSSVVTLGWGQTSDSVAGLVDKLQYVYLTTLSDEECRLAFGNQVNENMVCVGGNYNEGTCRGDMGSPLVQIGGSQAVYHVGLASWISSQGCESTDPSGFTRTASFLPWVNNITSQVY